MSGIVVRMDQVRAGRALAQRASDLDGIARRLIASRLAKGLRVRDLAATTGLGTNTIGNWEGATRRPRVDQLALVLPVLDVTFDWLYLGDDRALSWSVRESILAQLEKLPASLDPPAADSTDTAA